MSLEGKTFPVKFISNPHKVLHSSHVRVQRTLCLPPDAIVRVPVQLDNPFIGKYVVSPVCLKFYVLGSHTLRMRRTTTMNFISDTNTSVNTRSKKELWSERLKFKRRFVKTSILSVSELKRLHTSRSSY